MNIQHRTSNIEHRTFNPAVTKAALIYNPASGGQRHLRIQWLETAAAEFRAAGINPILIPTRAAGSAGDQAAEAIAAGHEMIFACGGDGTLHDVLQGVMASPRHADVPIGILPLGTGNIVANDLGLPRDPAEVVRVQLKAKPQRIAAGVVECRSCDGQSVRRYFIAVCSVGPDADIFDQTKSRDKARLGMLAYVTGGLRVCLSHKRPFFEVNYLNAETGQPGRAVATEAIAVRINNFGNLMQRFAPGAGLHRDDFQLVLFKTRSLFRYGAYLLGAASGLHWRVKDVELVFTREIEVRPLEQEPAGARPILAEADGEVLGQIPARISTVPKAFSLLMPAKEKRPFVKTTGVAVSCW